MQTICKVQLNILRYGTIDVPYIAKGRPKLLIENMWLTLKNQLKINSYIGQQNIAGFLYKQYHIKLSQYAISRALKQAGWTKKVTQNVAKECNQDLYDNYIKRQLYYRPD